MAFGIDKKYFSVILNPYMGYVYYKRLKLLKKYKTNNLKIGIHSSIENSTIGNFNYIGDFVYFDFSKIGDYSYVNSNSSIYHCNIGKFCSIASKVTLGLSKHPTNLVSTHPAFYSNGEKIKTFSDKSIFKEYSEINIGNDVWIGYGVTIPGGVKVGNGAIIAAGSIVTKDVEPFEVVGGVPAKHIKFRFSKEDIKKINESNWWDKEEKWFKYNYKIFLNKQSFFDFILNE